MSYSSDIQQLLSQISTKTNTKEKQNDRLFIMQDQLRNKKFSKLSREFEVCNQNLFAAREIKLELNNAEKKHNNNNNLEDQFQPQQVQSNKNQFENGNEQSINEKKKKRKKRNLSKNDFFQLKKNNSSQMYINFDLSQEYDNLTIKKINEIINDCNKNVNNKKQENAKQHINSSFLQDKDQLSTQFATPYLKSRNTQSQISNISQSPSPDSQKKNIYQNLNLSKDQQQENYNQYINDKKQQLVCSINQLKRTGKIYKKITQQLQQKCKTEQDQSIMIIDTKKTDNSFHSHSPQREENSVDKKSQEVKIEQSDPWQERYSSYQQKLKQFYKKQQEQHESQITEIQQNMDKRQKSFYEKTIAYQQKQIIKNYQEKIEKMKHASHELKKTVDNIERNARIKKQMDRYVDQTGLMSLNDQSQQQNARARSGSEIFDELQNESCSSYNNFINAPIILTQVRNPNCLKRQTLNKKFSNKIQEQLQQYMHNTSQQQQSQQKMNFIQFQKLQQNQRANSVLTPKDKKIMQILPALTNQISRGTVQEKLNPIQNLKDIIQKCNQAKKGISRLEGICDTSQNKNVKTINKLKAKHFDIGVQISVLGEDHVAFEPYMQQLENKNDVEKLKVKKIPKNSNNNKQQ